MTALVLHVKRQYFNEMRAGTKPFEYRLRTPYWRQRLEGRTYDKVLIADGYPSTDEAHRWLEAPWLGYEEQTITHPHFGGEPVEVFAIKVQP